MDNQQQDQLSKNQLLLNIYEKINISMDKKHIFEVILSELLSNIRCDSGAIQISSSDEKVKSYYGYTIKEGVTVWEPYEASPCPEYMRNIVDTLSDSVILEKKKKSFCISNIICSGFYSNKKKCGYIAVVVGSLIEQPRKDLIGDIIEAVSKQVVHILDQKNILEQKKYLEKMSLTRSMLSTLSHDIKNPLSGISGFAQLIGQRSNNDSIKKYCGIMLDSCLQLEDSLNTLRIILSGEAISLHKSEVSLIAIISEVINKVNEIYKHEGIDISFKSGADFLVEADKDKLAKILKSLLKNAKEAMPKGGKIDITLKKEGSFAKIEIADNGRGIPVHIQENIFKPFFTYGKENSAGLGLTIVKKIIEEHGGDISFSSSLNKGAIFFINLPIAKKEA